MISEKEIKKLRDIFNAGVFDLLKTEVDRGIITNVVSTGLLHTMSNIFGQVMQTVVGDENKSGDVEIPGADDSIDITEGQNDE